MDDIPCENITSMACKSRFSYYVSLEELQSNERVYATCSNVEEHHFKLYFINWKVSVGPTLSKIFPYDKTTLLVFGNSKINI